MPQIAVSETSMIMTKSGFKGLGRELGWSNGRRKEWEKKLSMMQIKSTHLLQNSFVGIWMLLFFFLTLLPHLPPLKPSVFSCLTFSFAATESRSSLGCAQLCMLGKVARFVFVLFYFTGSTSRSLGHLYVRASVVSQGDWSVCEAMHRWSNRLAAHPLGSLLPRICWSSFSHLIVYLVIIYSPQF